MKMRRYLIWINIIGGLLVLFGLYAVNDILIGAEATNFIIIPLGIIVLTMMANYIAYQYRKTISILRAALESDQAIHEHLEEGPLSSLLSDFDKKCRYFQHMEARLTEEKEEQHKMVTETVHQLKTPLSAMKLGHEILEKELDHPVVESLEGQLNQMEVYIESLKRFSALEYGLMRMEPIEASIKETIIDAINCVLQLADDKGIEIECEKEEDLLICHDHFYTREVVVNLLENAIKYSDEGSAVLIDYRRSATFSEVSVTNSGPLPNEEDIPYLFDRFYRGANSKRINGTGVGLYLCRVIMKHQDGCVILDRSQHADIRFCIRFYEN